MPTASGRYALVNGVGSLMEWSVSKLRPSNSYVVSNTRQGTARSGGITDWNGSLSGKGSNAPVFPGQSFAFQGYTAPDSGTEGDAGTIYTGTAIVSQITQTWNWGPNENHAWSATILGSSSLTNPKGTLPADTSALVQDTACGTFFTYGADIEIPALSTATLTVTNNISQTSNSSTRDAAGCFIRRFPGAYDWTLNATQEDHELGLDGYPDLDGQSHELKLYTNAADFWSLKWGIFQDYSNLTFNTDGSIGSRQINVAMNANNGGVGHIILPGQTTPAWGVA